MEAAPHPWPALGVLLLRDGLVEKAELEEILAEQRDSKERRVSGRRLGEVLIQRGRVTPQQVAKLVAEQYELPFVDFDVADLDLRVASILREEDARRFWAIPISRGGDGAILLAIGDPATVLFSDELRQLLGSVPRFAVVGPDAIERAIAYVYSRPRPSVSAVPVPESVDDLIVLPPEDTSEPAPLMPSPEQPVVHRAWPPLGALLLRDALVTDEDLEAALAQQRLAPSLRLGEILTGKGLVSRGTISRLVAEQYELPFYELHRIEVDPAVARRLPEEVAWRLTAVPIAEHEDGSLTVAVADPTSAVYSDDLRLALDVPLTFVVASPDDIEATLDRVHDDVQDAPDEHVEPAPDGDVWPTTTQAATTGNDVVSTSEPPHLVVEESISDVLDAPADEDESWPTRLELVEEIVAHEASEPAEPELAVLAWAPVGEIPLPRESLEADEPSDEAPGEVVDLAHPQEREPETAPEGATVAEAEVFELSWPAPPDDEDHGSLEEDLVGQIADALVAEAVEVSALEDADDGHAHERACYDIFGIGSLGLAEDDAAIDVPALDDGHDDEEPASAEHDLALVPELSEDADAEGPEAEAEPLVADDAAGAEVFAFEEQALAEATPDIDAEPDVAVGAESELEPEIAVETHAEVEVEHEVEVETAALPTEPPSSSFDTAVGDALAAGASAFHFSPRGDALVVRARVDGLVRDLGTATPVERDAFVERLESEGVGRTHVVTTARGPKTTILVHARASAPTSLDQLGLDADAALALRTALERPSGAILVCGPAGSGTTSTLYALLEAVATPERVVATVESPVARMLDGVDQIEVDPSGGVTFASALRELRLTDTDALLVGELVDREAASLALGAAYEGRLVVAGLRAPGAVAAVRRLLDLGVEPASLASSLGCVVSQRLVRTVCTDCRETYYASADELAALGQPETGSPRLLVRGTGCAGCAGTGFRGRTAVFEVLPVSEDVRGLIADGVSAKKLQKAALAGGMRTLRDEGIRLCLEGVTTVAEVARVLGDDL